MANRKKAAENKLKDKVQVYLTETERQIVDGVAEKEDRSASYVARELLLSGLRAAEETTSPVTLRRFSAAAPCGPFSEVASRLECFQIGGELAAMLGLLDDDLIVPSQGKSMIKSDIVEGSFVIMRPLGQMQPHHNEIVLAQVMCDDGTCLWTVKHWCDDGNKVVLKDGERKALSLPKNAIELHAVARKLRVIS